MWPGIGKNYTFNHSKPIIDKVVTIGNQSVLYDYEYQSPKLLSCNVITTTNLIEYQGNFTEFKSYYSNNEIDTEISNPKIQRKFDINDNKLSFPLLSEYQSGELSICGIFVSNVIIPPRIDKPIESLITYNSKGRSLTIDGQNFNNESIKNTFLECKNKYVQDKVSCLYSSPLTTICNFTIKGPNDVSCELTFDSKPTNQLIIVQFIPHTVLNVTNQINSRDGTISIIGTEFYERIDQITICNRPCFQPLMLLSVVIVKVPIYQFILILIPITVSVVVAIPSIVW